MLNDAQWLHILAAETDHLVAVSITLSTRAESSFRDALTRAFNSDGFSDVAQAWNYQRTQIIGEVIENHLYAVGVKYVREWLRDEVEERLATKCSQSLEHVG
jgi:transcription elongation factor SPT6